MHWDVVLVHVPDVEVGCESFGNESLAAFSRNECVYEYIHMCIQDNTRSEQQQMQMKNEFPYVYIIKGVRLGAKRLINLETPVLVRSLKSSNVELG